MVYYCRKQKLDYFLLFLRMALEINMPTNPETAPISTNNGIKLFSISFTPQYFSTKDDLTRVDMNKKKLSESLQQRIRDQLSYTSLVTLQNAT